MIIKLCSFWHTCVPKTALKSDFGAFGRGKSADTKNAVSGPLAGQKLQKSFLGAFGKGRSAFNLPTAQLFLPVPV
jgi:hypothetical protein